MSKFLIHLITGDDIVTEVEDVEKEDIIDEIVNADKSQKFVLFNNCMIRIKAITAIEYSIGEKE